MPRFPLSALCRRLRWEDLDEAGIRHLISLAKAEDLEGHGLREAPRYRGDLSTAILDTGREGQVNLVARRGLCVCGLPLVPLVLEAYGPQARFRPVVRDGDWVERGQVLGEITGPAAEILPAERVLLNFVQRLSGVATQTRHYVEAMGETQTRLLDTRKTTPGYRLLEKYAVACGGGWNHRLGLNDRIMLKDNHLLLDRATAGLPLTALVRRAIERYPDVPVEVEVDRLDQLEPVLAAGADVILLDNFTPAEATVALTIINDRAYTELSGGIELAHLSEFARLKSTFISTGALVHKAVWVDIGLDGNL